MEHNHRPTPRGGRVCRFAPRATRRAAGRMPGGRVLLNIIDIIGPPRGEYAESKGNWASSHPATGTILPPSSPLVTSPPPSTHTQPHGPPNRRHGSPRGGRMARWKPPTHRFSPVRRPYALSARRFLPLTAGIRVPIPLQLSRPLASFQQLIRIVWSRVQTNVAGVQPNVAPRWW